MSKPEPDFYYEGPYVVFTASYLRKRGYCCESGCRHCPYRGPTAQAQEQPREQPAPPTPPEES